MERARRGNWTKSVMWLWPVRLLVQLNQVLNPVLVEQCSSKINIDDVVIVCCVMRAYH
jgi:hypothetical protein